MKVGILGGTFDPVHNAHIVLAESALSELTLDLVLFIPAGEPWRKTRTITAAGHRLAMLKLAIAGHDAFDISDIELRRSGPTYTADTLEELAAERLDDEFYFIVGSDALADLPNWHEPERIVRHATLAVAVRDWHDVEVDSLGVPGLASRVLRFDMPNVDVSSTAVRADVAAGERIEDLVPPAVAAYIAEHELYKS